MDKCIIVGIGNQYRGDDAAGLAVIKALQNKVTCTLITSRGDCAELIHIFSCYDTVYLVDACLIQDTIGSWYCIDLLQESCIQSHAQTSTHGFGVAQAVGMAKNLGCLPKKLILYAISGSTYAMTQTISPQVNTSIRQVADEIIKQCQKNV